MQKNRLLGFTTTLVMILGLTACSQAAGKTVPTPLPTTPPLAAASDGIPITGGTPAASPNPRPPQYTAPLPNATLVSKNATIIVRYGPTLSQQSVDGLQFNVKGGDSGPHTGQILLADDQKTVIFKPDQPFTPGEQVQVSVNRLQIDQNTAYLPLSYSFTIAQNQQPGGVGASTKPAPNPPKSAFPNALTIPQDIPHFTVSTPSASANVDEGYIFVAPIPWTAASTGAYLLILDGQGNLVYYQSMADAFNAFDFKVQPGGLLSYFKQKTSTYYVMNNHYQVVDTYQAGDGYTTDLHDLLILPNGNALLMAYDAETVDMSKVVTNGKTDATVTGLVVQELDPHKNVIFEWRSWDYVSFTDSNQDLTQQNIDLIHGNALALANDGNLLLSSRNLSEITKIDLQTGAVIWRMGGKANQFQFVNDKPFAFQHDVRQLANGDLTLFDNHGDAQANVAVPSRGVEYTVDEINKTVTKVWEYQPSAPLPIFATYMGNTQRMADGNTFLDWGAPFTGSTYQFVTMTEVDPDNKVLFQLTFDQPYVSYRAFRSPWQGLPVTLPALAYQQNGAQLTLGYSWNGATDVKAWKVFGGAAQNALNLIEQQTKNGFETQTQLNNLPNNECYFQVAAVDAAGKEMARSAVISTNPVNCPVK
jgi:hypothetical protein